MPFAPNGERNVTKSPCLLTNVLSHYRIWGFGDLGIWGSAISSGPIGGPRRPTLRVGARRPTLLL